jgi:hypothetical protein
VGITTTCVIEISGSQAVKKTGTTLEVEQLNLSQLAVRISHKNLAQLVIGIFFKKRKYPIFRGVIVGEYPPPL